MLSRPGLVDLVGLQLSSRPSGKCRSKLLCIVCAASNAPENVAEPSPVSVMFCRRYLKRCGGILCYNVVINSQVA